MDKRYPAAVALAVAVTMPLLLSACGTATATSPGTAAPASAPTAPTSDVAASTAPSPAPSVDTARQTKQVQAATKKFVLTVLTIGYPDQTFGQYTRRIQPLMTKDGFDSLESAASIKKGSSALKTLHAQHARSAPELADDPVVTSLESTTATAELAYENVAQQKSGDGWKTLKSLGKGTVTVRLVLDDGKWLVDNAS